MSKTPYFLWDYDMSEEDVERVLTEGSEEEKRWLTARILTSAKYEDVWKYLSPRQVARKNG